MEPCTTSVWCWAPRRGRFYFTVDVGTTGTMGTKGTMGKRNHLPSVSFASKDGSESARSVHRRIAFDPADQAQRPFSKVGRVMGNLRLAQTFETRHSSIQRLDEPVEIGQ